MPFTFGDEHARTAPRLIAQQTAEMVCYLWFASSGSLARASSTTTTNTSKSAPPRTADTARLALQLSASGAFVDFVLKLLDTTQVSQSVIVLSLHYIYRLKEAGIFAIDRTGAGSERRVTVVALMLANKFVDDNTYTNKTWSEVAGIGLSEINALEREFLGAVGYRLAIDAGTYAKWLNLLRGLVQAKDRELRWWARAHARATPVNDSVRAATPRARSSSPTPHSVFPFTFTVPQPVHQHNRQDYIPPYSAPAPAAESPSVLRKRPAREAFSPPSYASSIPAKRALTNPRGREDAEIHQHQQQPPQLYIQTHLIAQQQQQPISAGGVERSFARMSLQHPQQPSPHTLDSSSYAQTWRPTAEINNNGGSSSNHNNVTASAAPQPLYYYKLASSPAEPVASTAESERERKGRLQYHQPALTTVHHSHHTHLHHPAQLHQQAYALLTPATATGVHQHQQQHHQHRFELGTGGGRHALSANASPLGIAPTSASSYQIYTQPQQQRQVVQPHLHNILTPPPSAPFQQVYTTTAPPPATAEVRPYAQHAPFANAGPAGVRMHWATSAPPASVPVPVPVAVQAQQETRARNVKRYPTPPQQQYPTPPQQQYPTPPPVQQQFPTPPSAQFYSPAVSSWQQHQPSPFVQAAQDQWPHALHHHHAHTRVPAIPADWVQPPMVV